MVTVVSAELGIKRGKLKDTSPEVRAKMLLLELYYEWEGGR